MTDVEIKWDQRRRFRLIEIIALWEGRLTTNHLCRAFHIGRQQASRDINRYQNLFDLPPLTLDQTIKGYKPSVHFTPRFSMGSANEYLALLHQQRDEVDTCTVVEQGQAGSEVVSVPDRHISPIIVRRLIQAARAQRRVDIDYVSLSSPQIAGRNIVPHTIVYNGSRWHVRAYCERNDDYRDFVLSRFRNEPELLDKSLRGREDDPDWNTQIEMAVIPNPYLSPEQQQIIAQDYSMTEGRMSLTSRKALVKYVVGRLNLCLDEASLQRQPKAFQLTVADRNAVRQYMIG